MKEIVFKAIDELKDLINSEGPILTIVESSENDRFEDDERLYLRAECLNGQKHIYCKVNFFALEMFFQGRILVKELFLMRIDEPFIIENCIDVNKKGKNQKQLIYNDEFNRKIINTIEQGEMHYYSIPEDMRLENPFKDIMKVLDMYYINGLSSIPSMMSFNESMITDSD